MLQVRLRNARDPVIWIHSKEASGFAYRGKLHIDLDVYAFPIDLSLPRPSRDPAFFHKDLQEILPSHADLDGFQFWQMFPYPACLFGIVRCCVWLKAQHGKLSYPPGVPFLTRHD